MIAVMTHELIYLDCNATTPCDPRVVEAMLPFMTGTFANPTTRNHRPGRDAATALERARATIDRLLGGRAASEVVFTAGATEANNLALMGAAEALEDRGRHIISQADRARLGARAVGRAANVAAGRSLWSASTSAVGSSSMNSKPPSGTTPFWSP